MTNVVNFRPFWHPIATTDEIHFDRPTRFTLLGENLVAFKTDAGVTVLKDLCIHRGSALSLGKIIDGTIECAYHGWRYDCTGKCVRIPALDPDAPIPGKAKAITYPVREYAGLVFVALEDPVAPFPEFREDYSSDLEEMRYIFVGAYDWTADAGRAVENFLDVAHFPFVHENTLGTRDNTLVRDHEIESDDFSMEYTYMQLEPEDPTTGKSEELALNYYYRAPFTVHLKRITPGGEFTVVSLFASPTDGGSSRLFVTAGRSFDHDPERDSYYSDFVAMVMNQDKAVVESVKPEEIPVDLRAELHIKVPDAAGLKLRRMLGQYEGLSQAIA